MALKSDVFDAVAAHPLRQARNVPGPRLSRIFAAAVTIAAHLVVIAAIAAGLRQVQAVRQPPVVMVRIEPTPKKQENLPSPPIPTLVKPTVLNAPVPKFSIASPPPSPLASLPAIKPAPPSVSTVSADLESTGTITWQSLLLARLEQAKRYPEAARMRRQQGVVLLSFAMDRNGMVLSVSVKKSSGFDILDQEALALVQRAQPLPKPPPEILSNPVELVVPIEFSLKDRRGF